MDQNPTEDKDNTQSHPQLGKPPLLPKAKNTHQSEANMAKPIIVEDKVESLPYDIENHVMHSAQSFSNMVENGTRMSILEEGTPKSRTRSRASSILSIQRTQKIVKINFLVDQTNGPFYKIQDAINEARDGTIIKVHTGLYKENLVIKNKSVVIEAKDINSDVYVLGRKGPTVLIDAEHSKPTNIVNIKFTHKGSINKRFTVNSRKIFNEKNLLTSVENYHLQFERLNFNETSDSVVYVKKGQLVFKKNLINLNLLTRESQLITPAIIIDSGTTVNIESCDLRGSQHFHTLGIAIRDANVFIKDTNVFKFRSGGIIMYVKPKNQVKIFKSFINNNKFFGIQILGNSASPSIQLCEIENNGAVGIQICTSNKCSLRKNTITLNRNGIEVISADPKIYDNVIERNLENGIMIKSIEAFVSIPIIRLNDISSNRFNGIYCTGMANKTKILKNTIHFNKKSGIAVDKSASVNIIDNDIHKNIFQGILLVEGSSAHIERNKIHENIKANIAFGGEESCNTTIIHNEIYQGRCEGIFLIDCGAAMISRNVIRNNYDGIVSITGIPLINDNKIFENKNHGIMLLKDSRPKILKNKIKKNKGVAIFVRDKSKAFVVDNEISGNDVGFIQERPIKERKDLKKKRPLRSASGTLTVLQELNEEEEKEKKLTPEQ